ncbi:MAG: thioredoxin [Clostridiales bacterium]|nr:thioredoxin [Clostridiales bacterium]
MNFLFSENFEETVKSAELPVVVDFWAEWCTPCRMIAPVIEELSDEMDGMAEFYKVDVEDAEDIASQRGVLSIPTIMILVGGEEKERVVGFRDRDELYGLISKYTEEE